MENNIRFISTTCVQPKNLTDNHFTKLELTPCDLQLLLVDTIQKGLLFHIPKTESFIEDLKASFSHTLDIFYPLAGRLAITEYSDDDTCSFSLDCNGAGAEFIHAIADDVTVGDIIDPVYVPDHIVYSLFTMNEVLNFEGKSKPLFAVQVTELVDGIFIGMTMNHSVGDGTSFWNFFNTWSQISSTGVPNAVKKPLFGREFLDGIIHLPIRIPSSQFPTPEMENSWTPNAPLKQRVFHFRKEKIALLKSEANAKMQTSRISSLQALMAHLWVSITRARRHVSVANEHEANQEPTMYTVIVGMRPRLREPLSDQYVGNAVLFGKAITTVGLLLEGGLGYAAMELNKVIALQTEHEVHMFLSGFAGNPCLPKKGVLMDGNVLATGSSPWFDVYGNDFGWGKPVAVRSGGGNKFDGKLTVFAGSEKGSIDFEACLSPQTLQALAEDEEFMQSLA